MTGYAQFSAGKLLIKRSDWTGENYVILSDLDGNLGLKTIQVIDGIEYPGVNVTELGLDADNWIEYVP